MADILTWIVSGLLSAWIVTQPVRVADPVAKPTTMPCSAGMTIDSATVTCAPAEEGRDAPTD